MDADMHVNHGTVLSLLDLFGEALAHFSKAHELDPSVGAKLKQQATWAHVGRLSELVASRAALKPKKLSALLAPLFTVRSRGESARREQAARGPLVRYVALRSAWHALSRAGSERGAAPLQATAGGQSGQAIARRRDPRHGAGAEPWRGPPLRHRVRPRGAVHRALALRVSRQRAGTRAHSHPPMFTLSTTTLPTSTPNDRTPNDRTPNQYRAARARRWLAPTCSGLAQVGDSIDIFDPLLLRVEVDHPDASKAGVRAGFHLVRVEAPATQMKLYSSS